VLDPHTLLLLAALAVPHPSTAAVPSANDSVLASLVSPLVRPGARVRVHTGFGITEGQAGDVSPHGLQMRCEQREGWSLPCGEPIPWTRIERLDLGARGPGQGVKIGAAFGCLLGIATVFTAASISSALDSPTPASGNLLLAGAAGGVVGGCLGALVGGVVQSVVPRWKTVFDRR
jgi:hypothetical protein